MDAVLELTADNDAVAFELQVLGVADMGQAQMLGNLRSDLRRIAVNGLTACDNQVIGQLLNGRRKRGRGCPGVSPAERAVRDEDSVVSPHGQRLTQGHIGLHRSHAQHRDMGAELVFQTKRRLKARLIVRIDDRRHTVADQGAGHRVKPHLGRIGNLLDTDNDIHDLSLLTACRQ